MKSKQNSRNQMSYWQRIFSQSKANGASYNDKDLPVYNWDWPTDTYLRRRRYLKESLTAFGSSRSSINGCDEGARL